MKSSTKGLFVIALIVMSFVAVPAAFAGTEAYKNPGYQNDDPGKPDGYDPCTHEVEGCVSYVAYRTIVIDGVYFKTPITWNYPQVDDEIWVKYWVNPDGVNVVCDQEILGFCGDDDL